MPYIYLQPLGQIDNQLLEKVGKSIQKVYDFPFKISKTIELPMQAYFRRRRQWHSSTILETVLNKNIPKDAEKVLGITDVDLFVENLNFVFGEADSFQGTAIISTFRLRPEYYMLPPNEELFQERVIKEAIHELGHTYGLEHCPSPACIMHFSNTLSDTDRKGPGFCEVCLNFLKLKL